MEKKNRTRRCYIRINEDDYNMFKEKSQAYGSMSAMVRAAVASLDDRTTIGAIDVANNMAYLFKKFQSDLSKVGGNLNQASKRANELAIGEQLTPDFFDKIFLPHVHETREFLLQVKQEQTKIVRMLASL